MKTSQFQDQAKEIAQRVDQARVIGEQLTFLPDPDGQGGAMVPADETPKVGRPKGSKNRADTQLRAMFAARGLKMPEDVLAEIAGLTSRDDVLVTAMARTEQVLAWAGSQHPGEFQASVTQRLDMFSKIYMAQVRALEALLPYGMAKVTPDLTQHNTNVTQIVMPGAANQPQPTVINGQSSRSFAPPPMPEEMQQNQEVINSSDQTQSDESRTE